MIKDNFYPDASTHLTTGEKFTAYVPSIPITTEQAPSAYWLGWISKDNLPQAFRHSEISLNNNGYQFSDITPDDNFDCGYNFRFPANHTYYADTPFRMVRYQAGVSKWQANEGNQNSNNFCFGNYINCMCDAISKVEIYVRYTIYDSNDTVVRRSMSNSAALLKSYSFEEFISFLGGEPITISFGEQGNVVITKQDLETGYFSKESSLGYTVETFVNAYKFIHTRSVNSNSTSDQGGTSKSSCFMAHINTEKYGDTIISGDDTGQGSVMQWDKRYPTQILDKILIWGLHGYFSFDDIDSLSWNGKRHIYNGNVLIFKPDNTYVLYVAAIFPIGEIEKHFNLCMRMSKARLTSIDPYAPYYGYIENDVYAPYITEDNEFTATRITGNLEDPEFLDKLRPWQYDVTKWEDNDYKEEDRPPYTPESGEDWDGDRILPPVISGIGDLNGFITMYGMTPSQVAALGSYLWARFTDTTFWESISAVLDNTASIDPSVILNYVVSIRAYPFDLSDVTGTTHEFPLVYFGRGLIGIPVEASLTSLSLRVLHKCVDSFAGGDLSVPAKYGDFRDMEPCAKLLLHVPFCGSCEINPSQVVGKQLFLRYTIDFATGGMMAICYTSDSAGEMAYPVAELHGHVGASVQLTGSNELDALQSLAGVGFGIASLIDGNPAGLLSGVVGAASSLASNRAVPHSTGKASGFSAYFQPRVPYIEIVYDQYYKPSNYAHIHGNACQAVKKIGSLHGYTVCKNVDTSGMSCESDERIMIKRIMESGFYVD